MESILINPKSKKELQFITEMLKRMNISMKTLSDEEKEDIALCKIIEKGMKTKSVPKSQIMKTLRK